MEYCESNKQMGRAYISRISMKLCKFKEELSAPMEALINAGWNIGEGAQGKQRLWVKMPTQDCSARSKKMNGMVENESVANHYAMGWAESIKWL